MNIDLDKYRTINNSKGCNTLEEAKLLEQSSIYNYIYNNRLSEFNMLINTDRADSGYINLDSTKPLKLLLDLDKSISKNDISPIIKDFRCNSNLVVTGDYITLTNKNSNIKDIFLITSKIEKRDGYDYGVIEYCNQILKTILPNGKLINYPCKIDEVSKYDLSVGDLTNTQVQKAQLTVTVQNNSDILKIKPSWRLIFGTNIYNVVNYDDATKNGLVYFKLEEDGERVGLDNWITGIADNSVQEKPSQTGNIEINGSKILKVGNTGTWNIQLDDGSAVSDNYTFTVSDTNKVSIVSQDGKNIVLKGLFYGEVKITATNVNDNTKSCWKVINVQNGW